MGLPPKPKKPAAAPKPPPPPKHVRSNIGEKPVVAADENRLKQLKELLGARTIVVDYQDSRGASALLCACFKGHEVAAQMLLEAKASVHLETIVGAAALFAACQNGHLECARLLLDKFYDRHLGRRGRRGARHPATDLFETDAAADAVVVTVSRADAAEFHRRHP